MTGPRIPLTLVIALASLVGAPAVAAESWPSCIGDARAVGRGCTGVVLADSVWGVLTNPAGSALTVSGTALQFSNNQITNPLGVAVYSGGVAVPLAHLELGTLGGLAAAGQTFDQSGRVSEYSVSAARLFLDDRLSLGLAFNYGFAGTTPGAGSQAIGATGGALFRLPKRFLLGAEFRSQMNYSLAHPWEFGIGFGQIVNRFFRYELDLRFLGPSLSSDSPVSLQPHLGMEYQFLDLRQFRLNLFSGGYMDNVRVHGTLGLGVDVWVFSVNGAADVASNYLNLLVGVGVDVGKVMTKLRIAPPSVPPPPGGIFPNPFEVNDDWLPSRLQDDPANSFTEIGASPERWKKRIKDIGKVPSASDGKKVIKDEVDSISDDWEEIKEELK